MAHIVYDKDCSEGIRDIGTYLSDTLGIEIGNPVKLSKVVQAFITPGYANDHRLTSYKRMEYLGDAVISAYVTRRLFDLFPRMEPKMMSKIGQYLWSNAAYPQYILESGKCFLGCIMFARTERNQPLEQKVNHISNTVSDCFEALVGALEAIGLGDEARKLIEDVLLKDAAAVARQLYRIPEARRTDHLCALAADRLSLFKDYLRNEAEIEGADPPGASTAVRIPQHDVPLDPAGHPLQ